MTVGVGSTLDDDELLELLLLDELELDELLSLLKLLELDD